MATTRAGRLPTDQKEARREEILDAALTELLERGPAGLTMAGVARRAGASKETLYAWFGSRAEVLRALIERTGDAAHSALPTQEAPLDTHGARAVLTRYATDLLTMLTAAPSVALNRAAMSSPELAADLLGSGRLRSGRRVEQYLERLHEAGTLHAPDPAQAFCRFYGLVVQDTQIRVLLGDAPPSRQDIETRAAEAVHALFTLHS